MPKNSTNIELVITPLISNKRYILSYRTLISVPTLANLADRLIISVLTSTNIDYINKILGYDISSSIILNYSKNSYIELVEISKRF